MPPSQGKPCAAAHTLPSALVAATREAIALVGRDDQAGARQVLWRDAKPSYELWLAAINKLIDYPEALQVLEFADGRASLIAMRPVRMLADRALLAELVACYRSEDAVVRLRVSSE